MIESVIAYCFPARVHTLNFLSDWENSTRTASSREQSSAKTKEDLLSRSNKTGKEKLNPKSCPTLRIECKQNVAKWWWSAVKGGGFFDASTDNTMDSGVVVVRVVVEAATSMRW
ncbi:hypothetical protein V8G54_013575 [Vigna mungo]|uniref:Uncharacterized protein n=1 Tax=Vigna mungo TaxID=3915 RepID=A0AAQ3S516_VIGMU